MSFIKFIFLINYFIIITRGDNIRVEADINITELNCTFKDSPILFYLPGKGANDKKYVMTEDCLAEIPGSVTSSSSLRLITEETEIESIRKEYKKVDTPYLKLTVTSLMNYFQYRFHYGILGDIFSPFEINDASSGKITHHDNSPNIARKFFLNSVAPTHAYIHSFVHQENRMILFAIDLNNEKHDNSKYFKTKIETDVYDCAYLNTDATPDAALCFYMNDTSVYYLRVNKLSTGEYHQDYEVKNKDGNIEPKIFETVTNIRAKTIFSNKTDIIAFFTDTVKVHLYNIEGLNGEPKIKLKSTFQYSSYTYGYWKPELFVIDGGNNAYTIFYVLFNGGTTIDIFTYFLERLTIEEINKSNEYLNFYGNIVAYLNNRFYITSTSKSSLELLYTEFNIPECIPPSGQYKSLNQTEVIAETLVKDNNDKIIDSYVYLTNYKRINTTDPTSYKGYFLCLSQNANNYTEKELLEDFFEERNLCDNIIYKPNLFQNYNDKDSYEYRIFSKIRENLFIPSTNKCTMEFKVNCYDTCGTCTYIGNITKHLCTQCPTTLKMLFYREYEITTENCPPGKKEITRVDNNHYCIGNNAEGDCLEKCPNGYYDVNLNNLHYCVPCYKGCETCDEIDGEYCFKCKEGYYSKSDAVQEEGKKIACYDDFCYEGYYFGVAQSTGTDSCVIKTLNCYSACKECLPDVYSTEYDMQCKECSSSITNYDETVFKEQHACINLKEKANFYYEAPVFKNCHDTCRRCETYGTTMRNNCDECRDTACNSWSKEGHGGLEKSERNRTYMIQYLDENPKVYAKSGFDFKNDSSIDAYILQSYFTDSNREMQSYANYIDTKEVETKLRKIYQINSKESIIFTKLDYISIDSKAATLQSEYAFYWEDNKNIINVTKLDLSKIDNEKLMVYYIPNEANIDNFESAVELSQFGINIYDYEDKFYHDQCFIVKLHNSDISLRDRIDHYYTPASLCERNCKFIRIDFATQRILCSCTPKKQINVENDDYRIPINENVKVKKYWIPLEWNYLFCYKLITGTALVHNYGFWLFLFFFILELIVSIHCLCFEFDKMNSRFEQVYHALKIKSPYYTSEKKVKKRSGFVKDEDLFLPGYIFFIDREVDVDLEYDDDDGNAEGEGKGKKFQLDTGNDEISKKEKEEKLKKLREQMEKEGKNFDEFLYKDGQGQIEENCKINKTNKSTKNKAEKFDDDEEDEEAKERRKRVLLDYQDEKPGQKHRKIYEINVGELILKYRLFKRGRMNYYNYIMAELEDNRKCCETFFAYFKDRFIVLRCFYKQSIMEFTSFNLTLLIYYFAELYAINLIFMTPFIFNEGYLNYGKITVTSLAKKSALAFLVSHYIARRIDSLEVFSGTFDIINDASKNADKFIVQANELLPEMKKTVMTSIAAKLFLILVYMYCASLFCITFSSVQYYWFTGGIGAFAIDFLFSLFSSLLIAVIRFCAIREESNYTYNFALFLNRYF